MWISIRIDMVYVYWVLNYFILVLLIDVVYKLLDIEI